MTARQVVAAVVVAGLSFLRPGMARAIDENETMAKALFSKLTSSLTLTPNDAKPGSTFLVLMNPGVYVDPDLKESNQDDRQVLAQILNIVPTASWIVAGDSGKRVDEIYGAALKGAEWTYVDPTPLEKAKLVSVKKTLFVEGDPAKGASIAYQKYFEYQAQYTDAVNAVEAARSEVANGKQSQIPVQLKKKVQSAQQAWETLGQKGAIEAAYQYYVSLNSSTANWFFDIRQQFDAFKETAAGEFHTTATYPRYAQWSDAKGWQKITFGQADMDKQTESNHVSYGGGGSGGWGLWSVSASAQHTHDDSRIATHIANLSISMEVKRVMILRPWFSQLLFESPKWRFGPNSPFLSTGTISDGNAVGGAPPKGLMPLYPTALLIARKVQITGADGNELQTFVHDHTSASGSVGWGPFAVSGNYDEDHQRGRITSHNITNGIEMPEPQVIGYFCLVLDKTPNPTLEPSFKWISDPSPAPKP